jgi:hypothetical protein
MAMIVLLTALAGDACEHFARLLSETYVEAFGGDIQAQINLSLYEQACTAALRQEFGDLTSWDCAQNLTPDAAMICQYEVTYE